MGSIRIAIKTLLLSMSLSVLGLTFSGCMATTAAEGWNMMPKVLSEITPPKFPEKDFTITQYGAKGDADTDCTEAFKKAIDACSAAGGGRVVVPAGSYMTGAIHLKSNVNLYVMEGATVIFYSNPRYYLPVVYTRFEGTECMNFSPLIYAFEQENIAITGTGTLDGSGAAVEAGCRAVRVGRVSRHGGGTSGSH